MSTDVARAAEILKRVGTPWFTTRKEGTGLGIANCQRLVGSAGGRLRIESPPGGISKSLGVTILIRSASLSIDAELSTVSEIALKPTQAPEKREAAQPHKPKSR